MWISGCGCVCVFCFSLAVISKIATRAWRIILINPPLLRGRPFVYHFVGVRTEGKTYPINLEAKIYSSSHTLPPRRTGEKNHFFC
ncbi:hypothetical protein FF1_034030 [Malus domestica]